MFSLYGSFPSPRKPLCGWYGLIWYIIYLSGILGLGEKGSFFEKKKKNYREAVHYIQLYDSSASFYFWLKYMFAFSNVFIFSISLVQINEWLISGKLEVMKCVFGGGNDSKPCKTTSSGWVNNCNIHFTQHNITSAWPNYREGSHLLSYVVLCHRFWENMTFPAINRTQYLAQISIWNRDFKSQNKTTTAKFQWPLPKV